MTRLQIVNSILLKCGQSPVSDVTKTKASKIVDRQIKESLDPVLSAQPWDEFKKYASLVATNLYAFPQVIYVTEPTAAVTRTMYLFLVDGEPELSNGSPVYWTADDKYSCSGDGANWNYGGTTGPGDEQWQATAPVGVPEEEWLTKPPKTGWGLGDQGSAAITIDYQEPVTPEYEYSYSFAVPNDFVRLVEEEPRGYKYDRVTGLLYGEYTPFELSYVALPTSTTLINSWQELDFDDAAFNNLGLSGEIVDILGYHVLSRCSYAITGDHNDTQIFHSLYKESLAKGASNFSQEKSDKFITVTDTSEDNWIGSRL